MSDLNQKIEDLDTRLEKIEKTFNLTDKKKKLSGLESQSMDPALWDDQERARKLMRNLDNLKKEIGELEGLRGEVRALVALKEVGKVPADFTNETRKLEKRVEKFELKRFLSKPYDEKNALVSIHAGQGGTEAMDWANMLYRMYLRFCERRGWKTDTVDVSEGEEAGVKSITFKVEGLYAYGYLKGEAGTHRLVRQSPFNADKLRQTSFALVEVLPVISPSEVEINESDIAFDAFRSGGAGGQNVNKVSTAVRVKHIPTNITVTAQTERSQLQNRENAMKLLLAKLWALRQAQGKKELDEIKGGNTQGSWGTQIRSYVLHPYHMIKDLRTEVETSNTDGVLDGDLDKFIEAELRG